MIGELACPEFGETISGVGVSDTKLICYLRTLEGKDLVRRDLNFIVFDFTIRASRSSASMIPNHSRT